MTPSHSRHRYGNDTTRKAVLYCPECGHASSIGGDWRVERNEAPASGRRTDPAREHSTDDRDVIYRCPECGTVVTTRPNRGRILA